MVKVTIIANEVRSNSTYKRFQRKIGSFKATANITDDGLTLVVGGEDIIKAFDDMLK